MDISLTDPVGLFAIALGLFLGGILKGATGAGMPVLAVPVIAAFYDVRVAVVVLVVPNLLTNLWQARKFRAQNKEPVFARRFALSGLVGAGIGTAMLVRLPVETLNVLLALIIIGYIGLRLAKPSFRVPMDLAERYAPLAGFSGGILQGTVGLSAPIAVSFANAIRFDRPVFIFTISVFFMALCVAQIPLQILFGLLTWNVALIGVIALAPLFAGLPIGDYLGKRMDPAVFDRTILVMLAFLAVKQLYSAFT